MEEKLLEFDAYIEQLFIQHANTNHKIFTDAFAKYPEVLPHLNKTIHNWYYGTFLNKIITMVFQPYLYDPDWSNSKPFRRLSQIQIKDALWHAYYLVTHRYCDPEIRDYYDETPFTYVRTSEKTFIPIDQDIYTYIPAFLFVLKDSSNAISKQQAHIRKWCMEYTLKRKHAVAVFEKRWLEIILNPDTKQGRKKIQKLSSHFYQLAKSP